MLYTSTPGRPVHSRLLWEEFSHAAIIARRLITLIYTKSIARVSFTRLSLGITERRKMRKHLNRISGDSDYPVPYHLNRNIHSTCPGYPVPTQHTQDLPNPPSIYPSCCPTSYPDYPVPIQSSQNLLKTTQYLTILPITYPAETTLTRSRRLLRTSGVNT